MSFFDKSTRPPNLKKNMGKGVGGDEGGQRD